MYHITYSERESAAWHRRNMAAHELENPQKRRVYRWGSHWGILDGDRWQTESRRPCVANADWEPGLVEECRTIPDAHIVPMEVDDIWEEEYVSLAKGAVEYNGLVSIRGDGRTVLEMAAKHGLPTPALKPTAVISNSQLPQRNPRFQQNQSPRPQRRCLIRD
jgi:hypothetical protein